MESALRKLMNLDEGCDLVDLESDIWRREAWVLARTRMSRRLARSQGVLALCAAIASAALGFELTTRTLPDRRPNIMIQIESRAPSELLLLSKHR